jgi:predicted phage-related endonuclease
MRPSDQSAITHPTDPLGTLPSQGRSPTGCITVPRPADRDAWLLARRPWFNASATATLFDCHPFTTLTAIVRAKLDEHPSHDEGNTATRRGIHLEPAIAGWWETEHGIALYEPDVMYARGPILATLDRRIVGSDTDAVEIKTTAKHLAGPEPYMVWQCQAQMYAAGLERVHVVILDASMTLGTYVVERDPVAIGQLVRRADAVMRYVTVGDWPPSVPEQAVQRHTDRVVELDDSARRHLTAWLEARRQLHELAAVEAAHKAELVGVLGDAQAATVDGATVLTYRSHTRTSVDLARLRAEHADVAAELSTEQVVRVLRPIEARPVIVLDGLVVDATAEASP